MANLWSVNSTGGYLYSPKLSKQMREQAAPMFIFRQFVDISEKGLGANAGDRVIFDKQLRIDTRGTTLVETTTMPKNTIKFTTGTNVVNEYGKLIAAFVQSFFDSLRFTTVAVC